jgi:hypothetical protein
MITEQNINFDRIEAWYNGDIADTDLDANEISFLEHRVFVIISERMLNREDRFTFAEHDTLQ